MAIQKLGKRNGVISKKPKKSEFYTFDGETLIFDTGEFVFELENYSKNYQRILNNIDENKKINTKNFAQLLNKNTILNAYINEDELEEIDEKTDLILEKTDEQADLILRLLSFVATLLKYQPNFFEIGIHLINNKLVLRQSNLIFNDEIISLNIDKYTSVNQLIDQRKYIGDLTTLTMIISIIEVLVALIKDKNFKGGTYKQLIDNSKKISRTLTEAIEKIQKIEINREFQKNNNKWKGEKLWEWK